MALLIFLVSGLVLFIASAFIAEHREPFTALFVIVFIASIVCVKALQHLPAATNQDHSISGYVLLLLFSGLMFGGIFGSKRKTA